jgi:hypothetical protein
MCQPSQEVAVQVDQPEADVAVARRIVRAALSVLALQGVVIGLWAATAPRSFYDDFPGGGRAWVAADGPYNEHLVRDFGDLHLALAAVSIVALVTLVRAVVLAAGLAWVVFQAPHLVYHLRHLDVFETGDQVASIASLVVALAIPIIVMAVGARLPRSP